MIALARNVETDDDRDIDEHVEAARRFYCDVLDGRQIASPTSEAERALWFMVRGALIETGYERRDQSARIALRVKNPEEIAARCWDAGYTVLMHEEETSAPGALAILDPFGLRIDLRHS
jgi:hypothetical protein